MPLRRLGFRFVALFCAATVPFLIWRDLFLPEVRDVEVWFGFELRGAAAIATAPLHWAIFVVGAWAYARERAWVWPWAALYAFGIAISHVVWNLTSPSGGGAVDAAWQFVLFSIPAAGLLALRPEPSR